MTFVQELLRSTALRMVGLSVQMATERLTDLHHLSSGGVMAHALFCYVWNGCLATSYGKISYRSLTWEPAVISPDALQGRCFLTWSVIPSCPADSSLQICRKREWKFNTDIGMCSHHRWTELKKRLTVTTDAASSAWPVTIYFICWSLGIIKSNLLSFS